MNSKTPNFDKVLEDYYRELKLNENGGQWRTCRFSGEKFYVQPEDIGFYKRIGVPLPTLSPAERLRRRGAYLNNYNLFKISSAHSQKPIVAAYPPDTPYKIFEHKFWFSGKWNPLDYGFAPTGDSFFAQFGKLQKAVPRPNLITDSTNIGSDYTNTSINLRDCYFTFSTLSGENLYYFDCCDSSKDCVDCESAWNATDCYHSQLVYDCYKCAVCEDCRNCLNSFFLFDCRDCDHCFMSSNLRHKKYYFMNRPLPKEEYEAELKKINLGNYLEFLKYLAQFDELQKEAIRKPDHNFKSVNCSGDFILNSKNCHAGNYLVDAENVNYSFGLGYYKDSYDGFGGGGGELCYEFTSISTTGNYNVKFSVQMGEARDVEYCDLCRNCHDCFGCIGLQNKSFCVLNKQYSEGDYWRTVDDLKMAMLKNGEYGEFFPPKLMPIPYKLSFMTAYNNFCDYEKAERYGYDVRDVAAVSEKPEGEIINAADLPEDIKDVDDSMLKKAVFDDVNNRYFRIVPYELAFYRRNSFPLPRIHPLQRLARFREIYDFLIHTYARHCKKCGVAIVSVFDPKEYESVYCESCYNAEVV
ncbi:MAG: hypothetical protein ABSF47_01570 [Minisyncoccia bacterium]|jgi:hypothetical protein